MNNLIRTRNAILEAINAIDEAIPAKTFSQSVSISQDQLQRFRIILLQMLSDSLSINQPVCNPYTGGMGRVIVDTWPINDPLGKVILNAEQMYLNVTKQLKSKTQL